MKWKVAVIVSERVAVKYHEKIEMEIDAMR